MAVEQVYEVTVKLRVNNYGLPKDSVRSVVENGIPEDITFDRYTVGVEHAEVIQITEVK